MREKTEGRRVSAKMVDGLAVREVAVTEHLDGEVQVVVTNTSLVIKEGAVDILGQLILKERAAKKAKKDEAWQREKKAEDKVTLSFQEALKAVWAYRGAPVVQNGYVRWVCSPEQTPFRGVPSVKHEQKQGWTRYTVDVSHVPGSLKLGSGTVLIQLSWGDPSWTGSRRGRLGDTQRKLDKLHRGRSVHREGKAALPLLAAAAEGFWEEVETLMEQEYRKGVVDALADTRAYLVELQAKYEELEETYHSLPNPMGSLADLAREETTDNSEEE